MPETREIELRIHLDATTPGAIGGVQIGSGASATVPAWRTMDGGPATFVVKAEAKEGKAPLRGPALQKDGKGRFVYIVWRGGAISRRAKIYLESIDQTMLDSGRPLEILLPGLAKDGLPCCATVKPIRDWSAN